MYLTVIGSHIPQEVIINMRVRNGLKRVKSQDKLSYALGNGRAKIEIDSTTGTATMIVEGLGHGPDSGANSPSGRKGRKVVKGSNEVDQYMSMVLDLFDKCIDKQMLNNASAKLIRRLAVILEDKTKLNTPFLAIRDKQSRGGTKGNQLRRSLRS